MKKSYKVIISFIIALILVIMSNNVYAKDIWNTANRFLETGGEEVGMLDESISILEKLGINTKVKFEELIDFLWGLGLLVIFITTVVLGIRYMFVSPKEKSNIKQITMPYIIGVVVIFGALTIWKLVIWILEGSLSSI